MIPAGDGEGLERVAAYILRPPLSLSRLTYVPGSSTAIYRTPDSPVTGGNFITLDAKELLVRLLCLVPRPWECLIRYYGAASSTWRRAPPPQPLVEEGGAPAPPVTARPNRRSGSWARMLKRVYGIDPLVCPKCSSKMSVIATINDGEVIERILRHLDRWDPPSRSPAGDEPSERRVIYDEDLPVYEDIDEPP